jgi:hypothetical protein
MESVRRMKTASGRSRKLFSWFSRKETATTARAESTFLSAPVFQAHLNRERARSDRNGSTFVVLTMDVEGGREHAGIINESRHMLACCVDEVFRLCDTKGWHEQSGNQVAVIMPDADDRDTASPIRRTEDLFSKRFLAKYASLEAPPRLHCRVHNYPNKPEVSDDERDSRLNLDVPVFGVQEVAIAGSNGSGSNGRAQG